MTCCNGAVIRPGLPAQDRPPSGAWPTPGWLSGTRRPPCSSTSPVNHRTSRHRSGDSGGHGASGGWQPAADRWTHDSSLPVEDGPLPSTPCLRRDAKAHPAPPTEAFLHVAPVPAALPAPTSPRPSSDTQQSLQPRRPGPGQGQQDWALSCLPHVIPAQRWDEATAVPAMLAVPSARAPSPPHHLPDRLEPRHIQLLLARALCHCVQWGHDIPRVRVSRPLSSHCLLAEHRWGSGPVLGEGTAQLGR